MLVTRYVTALDGLDADAYEGVFTPDGEYEVTGTVYKGRAIRKIVTDLQASRALRRGGHTVTGCTTVLANSSIESLDKARAPRVSRNHDGRSRVRDMPQCLPCGMLCSRVVVCRD